jgi:cellulose synthase/poly-beta-1,6-N-acetylglucosamine synthase-like glycosyltransferase
MEAADPYGVPRVTVAIPCRADEPGLTLTIEEVLVNCRRAEFWGRSELELLVLVNGPERRADARPVDAFRRWCDARSIPFERVDLDAGEMPLPPRPGPGRVFARLLTTPTGGKARAWNTLRAASTGSVIFFCDADVTFSPDAFARLYAGLLSDGDLALFSPKTDCRHEGTLLERVVAAPYRLDFPNLSGQLYAMRPERIPEDMPEDLIEPERWLELAVGPGRVGRDPAARVYVRATATLRDFFRQRVRIEMGKIQLARAYGRLLDRSRPQPRAAAVLALGARDQVALASYLVLRSLAQAWAWWRYRERAVEWIWKQPRTTKETPGLQPPCDRAEAAAPALRPGS